MNVLVTGGEGYIGSAMIGTLLDEGHEVISLDNNSRGCYKFDSGLSYKRCDLRRDDMVKELLCNERIDAVINFAAFAYVGESMSVPYRYLENNLNSLFGLLNGIRSMPSPPKHIIFSSTCSIYGDNYPLPITEEFIPQPANVYAESKLYSERILESFAKEEAIKVCSLRYFNVAGAQHHRTGLIGERHNPETHLIPLAIRAAITGEPFYIFGNDYETRDGTCVRDYIHVTDLCKAHLYALNWSIGGVAQAPLEIFNIGTGHGYTVNEVLDECELVVEKKINRITRNRRLGDPAILVANPSRANRILGWRSERSLRDMVIDAYEFELLKDTEIQLHGRPH